MKTILAILLFAGTAQAGVPFWQPPVASTKTASGTGYISGSLKIYPSTTTAAFAPAIFLDGVNRQLSVRNGASVTTMTATGFQGSVTGAASLNVLKSGDTMTGPLTLSGSSLTVTAKGFEVNGGNSIYVNPTTGNVGIGGVFAPAYPFVVKSSRINLHQTNDASYVYMRHADTTGNSATLTLGAAYGNWVDSDGLSIYNGNTTALKNLTVAGSAFSVGGSTLVVSGGKVGIGIAAPLAILHSYSPAVGAPSLSDDVNTSQLFETGAQGAFALGQYAASPYAMWLQGKGLNVSTSYPLSIQPLGGNVGIGTTAPGAKLDVSSGVINNAGAGAGITTTGNITAAFIYGNGSGLTGLPGGGDAILASTQTFTGINTFVSSASFSGVTSTVTFYGWIDIGLEIMTDGGTAENDSVSCSGGKRVIGGGCYTTSAVYTSYPETSVKWTCRTAVAQPIEAYAICARVK